MKIAKYSIPFALTSLFYNVYYSIDIVMITTMVGDYANGIYTSAYKLIYVLSLFYTVYVAVVFPIMSKFFKNEKKLLSVSFEKSVKYLTLITVPIAIFIVFYSNDIITLLFGSKYSAAGSVLEILIWSVCFLFINGACSILLNASHKEFSVTKIYAIAALFNIILNFILIPKYSFIGASIATVLSEILILFLLFYVLSKINQLPNKHLYFDVGKIIIASVILMVVLSIINVSMWIAIPLSIVVYLITILLLRILDDNDKYIIKEILGK
jgi:O-antigen/teichoic acid export membrane protein